LALLNQILPPSKATGAHGLGPSVGPDHISALVSGVGISHSSSSAASVMIKGVPRSSVPSTYDRLPGANHVKGDGVAEAETGGWAEQATSRNASAATRLMTG
jgi:hypothetical protein